MGFGRIYKAGLRTLHGQAAFGEPVTYRPKAGGEFEINGVYTAPYQLVDPQEIEVQSTQPMLSVRDQELEAHGVVPVQEDKVVVRGTVYWVADVQPDGEGATRLPLHEVTA